MKTLKDFTPEIQAKIPQYIERAMKGVSDGGRYNSFDIKKAKACIKWNYEKCGYKMPMVLVAENPYEMNLLFNFVKRLAKDGSQLYSQLGSQLGSQLDSQLGSQLEKTKNEIFIYNSTDLFTVNFYSDCYYAWYEFIRKELNLPLSVNEDFQTCFELQRKSGISTVIFSEALCVVCKYPKKVYWNEENRMHNTTSVAVEWGSYSALTKFDCYYINGRNVPSKLFTEGFTKQDFLSETNEDIRAAMFEIVESKGEGSMLAFLEAREYNKESVVHKNGDIEELILYRTNEKFPELKDLKGNQNVPLCWLKLQCPSTGQVYLISTDASFKTASEAAKFHRPEDIPFELDYVWHSRN